MIDIPHEFEYLGSRKGFNKALTHFRTVSEFIGEFGEYINLADLINVRVRGKELNSKQIVPIVHAMLIDKYAYTPYSHTFTTTINEFSYIYERVGKWKAVDVTLVYFHPDLGPLAINPKNPKHFSFVHEFKENELITMYVGAFGEEVDEKLRKTAIKTMLKLLDGKKAKNPDSLLNGPFPFIPAEEEEEEEGGEEEERSEAPAEGEETETGDTKQMKEPSKRGGNMRMTPFYSVPVTNELFHNGNVEAWKKIIQSYKSKHPDLEVYIYYEGERIHDIASLFKWGKVKHGSSIVFAVAGEDIKDVAKLQRYLKQGAGTQFEAFLRAPENKILNLF